MPPPPADVRRRIVLTGGPGAGKTVIARLIAAAEPDRFAFVPEAATQVYAAMDSRWDRLDLATRREAQRNIYRLQRRQEDEYAAAHPHATLLLDRGTLDCAAYWPDGAAAFMADVGTTAEAELARYGHVLWLETGAALGIYDGHDSNACRFEDAAAAIASGERVRLIYAAHPSVTIVAASSSLERKVREVRDALQRLTNEA